MRPWREIEQEQLASVNSVELADVTIQFVGVGDKSEIFYRDRAGCAETLNHWFLKRKDSISIAKPFITDPI